MQTGLIYTNDKCVGCNVCVKICNSDGASRSNVVNGRFQINIDAERCVGCGACINVCERGARSYHDDTERFFGDLERGEPISFLVAPSFEAKYPSECAQILGGLRELGVRRILSVGFGADICTWAYLKLIRERGYTGRISSPCPVVVSYIEHCMPELMDHLMPVLSPMMCAARYCREVIGMTDRLAFLGPCIGKRMEMDRYPDLVQYNVTFPRLMEEVERRRICGPKERGEIEPGLGCFYPAPGGLADNLRWFLGDDVPVRVISGKRYLFKWLQNSMKSAEGLAFTLVDALNCREGCIEGTATQKSEDFDLGLISLNRVRSGSKRMDPDSPWNEHLSCEERLRNLDRQFEDLRLADYLCAFVDQSASCQVRVPTPEEEEAIFLSMHKHTKESREINCSACGYEKCRDMVSAIHNGFNTKRNCVYYEKEEMLLLERQSYTDELTSVMNRNALEKLLHGAMFTTKSVGVIVADVNGLKQANDTLGHAEGDKLIIGCASVLAEVFGAKKVYRTGGDEFLVILQDIYEEELGQSLERVRRRLEGTQVRVAFGSAFCKCYDGDFQFLHEKADAAMYADKQRFYKRTGLTRRVGV